MRTLVRLCVELATLPLVVQVPALSIDTGCAISTAKRVGLFAASRINAGKSARTSSTARVAAPIALACASTPRHAMAHQDRTVIVLVLLVVNAAPARPSPERARAIRTS